MNEEQNEETDGEMNKNILQISVNIIPLAYFR
jgi:hypothetical protein